MHQNPVRTPERTFRGLDVPCRPHFIFASSVTLVTSAIITMSSVFDPEFEWSQGEMLLPAHLLAL